MSYHVQKFDDIRMNQLPVSATRWQHRSQICFVTFIQWKITKLLITQQPLKLKKKSTDWESLEFSIKFDVSLTEYKNNKILLNKISHWFLLTTKLLTGQKSFIWHKSLRRSLILLQQHSFLGIICKISAHFYFMSLVWLRLYSFLVIICKISSNFWSSKPFKYFLIVAGMSCFWWKNCSAMCHQTGNFVKMKVAGVKCLLFKVPGMAVTVLFSCDYLQNIFKLLKRQ